MREIPVERQDENQPLRPFLTDDMKSAGPKIAVFQYVTVGVFLFLLTGYWDLQVRNPDLYNEKAERNWIRSQPLPAPRGKILDRDGRVIVDNVSSYRLLLSRDNLREEHIAPIAQGISIEPNELAAKLRRLSKRPRYESVSLKESLTENELAFVESHRSSDAFPELELVKSHQRLYPQDGVLAHLIGYTGEINDQELNTQEFARYNPGDIVGKFGIERFYNDHLTGKDGSRQVKVDNTGFEREVLGIKDAIPGKDLRLTIDLDLQSVAELAMDGRRGAVVALDPRNGEVLAMVSRPAFDANHFVGRIESKEWSRLLNDPDKPMMNRAIQSQLSPGSTFKPIVALAALEEGVIDENFTVNCAGSASFYGRSFKCHKVHGVTNFHKAIVQSCDVYFYTVGNKLGIDSIAKYGEMAGLGRKTGIDIPQEKEGDMPSSSWKIRKFREKWYAGETISVAIGQGYLTLTPLQLAHAIGGIATGGIWMKPHLVKDSAPAEPSRRENLNIENVSKVIAGMYGVVNEGGTASGFATVPTLTICGKTGTSQIASNDYIKAMRAKGVNIKDNAWFVGFAPRESPEIVVAVLFEEGMHGNYAAPMARDVIKAYFDKQARRTVPPPIARTFGVTPPAEPRP